MYNAPRFVSGWGLPIPAMPRASGNVECHLCVRYCSGHWGCGSDCSTWKPLHWKELLLFAQDHTGGHQMRNDIKSRR